MESETMTQVNDSVVLPEPDFELRWHSKDARYTVSKPNIGDTSCYTADTVRALLAAAQAPAADALDAACRSDAEIVKRTEQAARFLLGWKYGMEPESSDAQLRHSGNTKAQWAWDAACRLQEIMTDSDAMNAAQEVDDAADEGAA